MRSASGAGPRSAAARTHAAALARLRLGSATENGVSEAKEAVAEKPAGC